MSWDMEVDFVSVGGGIGGLAGATVAAATGATALVLEKDQLIGGVTAVSIGELWLAGTHLQAVAGIQDSPQAGIDYIEGLALGCSVPELTRALCMRGPEVLSFFERECGLEFQLIDDFPDYFWPDARASLATGRYFEISPFDASVLGEWQSRTALSGAFTHGLTNSEILNSGGFFSQSGWDRELLNRRVEAGVRCMGPGLIAAFLKAALDRGVTVKTSTAATRLIAEHGRVVGLEATDGDAQVRIRARQGILLATGGYDWNPTLRTQFDADPEHRSQAPRTVTGDHFALAGRIGARVATVPAMARLGFGLKPRGTDREMWASAAAVGLPHAILVNRKGRRFADESFQTAYSHAVRVIDGDSITWRNQPSWIVFDESFHAQYPLGSFAAGQWPPDGVHVYRADSLRKLAQVTGIDADGLADEVARFNEFVATGVDADFHRGERPWSVRMNGDPKYAPNPNLGTVAEPPFYAVRLRTVGSGLGAAGLACDEIGRVIDYDDKPIEGLYAVGNAMALLDLGAGYQSGLANSRAMTFGFLAAQHAGG